MLHKTGKRAARALKKPAVPTQSFSALCIAPRTPLSPKPHRIISVRANGLATQIQTPAQASADASTSTAPRKPHFTKVLIANRGEIACRVMRTCRKLGIKTVAVYSEADKNALHVKEADEAYCIGPAPSAESYLRADKIIEVAHRSGAQAIHPGYGFLSENASFADLLAQEGLTFIGPPASAITAMGSKSESKRIMIAAGVPCVPGYHGENQDPKFLHEQADEIGYPCLIKATKGGGGKGMKIVQKSSEFMEQLDSAKREALKGFGDDTVLVEKYLANPRHVEVQVFADSQGSGVYLFERDCSVQRRHQKIIEEAPAPGLSEEMRRELGEKAVAAAQAVGYVGAGTVEYVMDAVTLEWYFLEMNTRLQVEHPITEMISNTDLVDWQLQVAAGSPLPKTQEQLVRNGWAFEARIYAENPRNNFLPDTGLLHHVKLPETEGVRLETGFNAGDEISVFYDPMIAKLIVHGEDRESALQKLRVALADYQIVGPHTNIPFLSDLAAHPAFVKGDVETGFITRFNADLFKPLEKPSAHLLAQAGLYLMLRDAPTHFVLPISQLRLGGDRYEKTYTLEEPGSDGKSKATIHLVANSTNQWDVTVTDFAGQTTNFSNVSGNLNANRLIAQVGEEQTRADFVNQAGPSDGSVPERIHIFSKGQHTTLAIPMPSWFLEAKGLTASASGSIKAPMQARVVQVFVKDGDVVQEGQALCACESMKTEHILRAPRDGTVAKVTGACSIGQLVKEGELLVELEAEAEAEASA